MCPMCVAAAALIAGKVTLAGGLAVIGIKKLGVKDAAGNDSAPTRSKLPDKENAAE